MSVHDWIAMEEQVMKRTPEDQALLATKIYQPPARRRKSHPFAWLAGLLHRQPPKKEEPQPARPAYR